MKEKRDEILKLIDDLTIQESLELLSNVMIAVSLNHLDIVKDTDQFPSDWNECINLLLEDKKANGETLANALGRQAITMIMWLNNKKEEK